MYCKTSIYYVNRHHIPSKKLANPVHHFFFMLHERMDISIQRNGRRLMPKDFGKRLCIHPAFYGTGSKGMAQGMEFPFRDPKLFQKQLKAPLIGADRNRSARV